MLVPIKPEGPEVEVTPRTEARPAQGSRDNWRAVRLLRAMVVISEIFVAEEERLVIEVEGEGTHAPPSPNRPELKASPFMGHDDVVYADSEIRGPRRFLQTNAVTLPGSPTWHFDRVRALGGGARRSSRPGGVQQLGAQP